MLKPSTSIFVLHVPGPARYPSIGSLSRDFFLPFLEHLKSLNHSLLLLESPSGRVWGSFIPRSARVTTLKWLPRTKVWFLHGASTSLLFQPPTRLRLEQQIFNFLSCQLIYHSSMYVMYCLHEFSKRAAIRLDVHSRLCTVHEEDQLEIYMFSMAHSLCR